MYEVLIICQVLFYNLWDFWFNSGGTHHYLYFMDKEMDVSWVKKSVQGHLMYKWESLALN